ncbi:MAG: aspartate aminotransferase family protein, partial [Cyanobacteria bacterium M_surface_10_m1_298]|nr:aspartate aminotransferase family protein [Cyanobacteria bacterium M_surface_10_m1_298]
MGSSPTAPISPPPKTPPGDSAVMNTYGRFPLELVRGRGVWVWDSNGRRYLDG